MKGYIRTVGHGVPVSTGFPQSATGRLAARARSSLRVTRTPVMRVLLVSVHIDPDRCMAPAGTSESTPVVPELLPRHLLMRHSLPFCW